MWLAGSQKSAEQTDPLSLSECVLTVPDEKCTHKKKCAHGSLYEKVFRAMAEKGAAKATLSAFFFTFNMPLTTRKTYSRATMER
jgi:hypothetical protein